MSKVMTFSRVYPSYHPKAGQPTEFVAKIWESIYMANPEWLGNNYETVKPLYPSIGLHGVHAPKHHTIRAGHRWKEGDWFRPVVWGNDVNPKSGRSGPYHSKQITFAPDIQVKKAWPFQIIRVLDGMLSSYQMIVEGKELPLFGPVEDVCYLAKNDGLEYNDFCDWFKMDTAKKDIHFDGQIICWNENIEY